MGTGFAKKKKQARMLQDQLSQMQNKMQETEVTGTAGNGLVSITLTGEHHMKSIRIKPECVDLEDIEGLQDLVKSAYNEAIKQLEAQSASSMSQIPSGLSSLGLFG